jgi:hypothetical protein
MAVSMYAPNACSLTSPPGLNTFDSMMPAKVEMCSLQQTFPMEYMGANDAAQFSSGEWASKVHSVAPFLNTKGLHRALAILDQAIFNVQRVKAMEDMLASSQQGSADLDYDAQYAALSWKMCQVQVYAEQQQLLAELQQLPFDPSSVRKEFSPPLAAGQNHPQQLLVARGGDHSGVQAAMSSKKPRSRVTEINAEGNRAFQQSCCSRELCAQGANVVHELAALVK